MKLTMNNTLPALMLAIHAMSAIPAAAAGESKPTFGFDAGIGYQYDSNVNIAQLDTNTGEADTALTYELGLDGNIPITDKLTLNIGYGYTKTAYQDFSEFDLGLHQGSAQLGYRIGRFDTAIALRHFVVMLDNDRFMNIRQVSPSVSRLFGESFYLRAAYTNAEKTYEENFERDAVNDAIGADAYFLLDGMKRYVAIGIEAASENALDAELDYDGMRLKATYGHQVQWLSRELDFKARVQVEDRDYANVTETIAAPRHDERFRASLSAGLPLSETFSLEGEAAYADNASNLDSAAYDETVFSVNFTAAF